MSQGVVFFIEGPDDERFIEQVIKPILTTENVNTHLF